MAKAAVAARPGFGVEKPDPAAKSTGMVAVDAGGLKLAVALKSKA